MDLQKSLIEVAFIDCYSDDKWYKTLTQDAFNNINVDDIMVFKGKRYEVIRTDDYFNKVYLYPYSTDDFSHKVKPYPHNPPYNT